MPRIHELSGATRVRWSSPFVSAQVGDSPIVATAIHDGHDVRPSLTSKLSIDEDERLREEDPYTGYWTTITDSHVVPKRSRFEVDLNRPEESAVYTSPEQAWGMHVWLRKPDEATIEKSRAEHREFYDLMHHLLEGLMQRYGGFVVLDLHSYNHRRAGPRNPPADIQENPEVNVGTRWLDRDRWGSLVDRFISDLRQFDFLGTKLDVRENVKFKGGYFAQWVADTFQQRGAVLAVELKKFYMDEWTGTADDEIVRTVRHALLSTVPGLTQELAERVVPPSAPRPAQPGAP